MYCTSIWSRTKEKEWMKSKRQRFFKLDPTDVWGRITICCSSVHWRTSSSRLGLNPPDASNVWTQTHTRTRTHMHLSSRAITKSPSTHCQISGWGGERLHPHSHPCSVEDDWIKWLIWKPSLILQKYNNHLLYVWHRSQAEQDVIRAIQQSRQSNSVFKERADEEPMGAQKSGGRAFAI